MGHSIGAGVITTIGNFPVTNTMLSALLTSITLIVIAIIVRISLSIKPNKLQSMIELIYEFLGKISEDMAGKKRTRIFLPWIVTIFLFILVSNYWGLTPIFGQGITVKDTTSNSEEHEVSDEIAEVEDIEEEHSELNETSESMEDESSEETEVEHHFPLFRGATSDPNLTFALGLVSFLLIMGYGLIIQGPIGFLKHYFKTKPIFLTPVYIFVGLLELLLEPLKATSLSLRLFGNIFAGEMLVESMTVINGISIPLASLPFLLIEILVGFIQAFVFSLLTLVFISVITDKH